VDGDDGFPDGEEIARLMLRAFPNFGFCIARWYRHPLESPGILIADRR